MEEEARLKREEQQKKDKESHDAVKPKDNQTQHEDHEIKQLDFDEIKKNLTPLQHKVAIEGGTEPPFNNAYWNNKEEGLYVSIVSGEILFSSKDKFDSGTGWPSFSRPANDHTCVKENTDTSHGMVREEVHCDVDGVHLGHVFDDGIFSKSSTGKRYCIDSASLKFVAKKDLTQEQRDLYFPDFSS